MIVELKGKSLKGVFAMAHNQGCIAILTITKRAGEGVWRLGVVLPPLWCLKAVYKGKAILNSKEYL